MVKIGWKAGIEQYQPDNLLTQVVVAEQEGFDSIDVSDHFNPWSEAGHITSFLSFLPHIHCLNFVFVE